ncbi:MAG: pyridoxal kinase [Rhizobiaceae bacterium]
MKPDEAKPAVVVISSHVARGSVGNRAIVFALETLGFRVWSVPTIMLPWHPGHGPATRIIPDSAEFKSFLDDLAAAPWLDEIGAILTGYLGHADQAGPINQLIDTIRQRNPGLIYLCDPVIGDNGGLYVPEKTAEAIRDQLLPLADIATPNRFELGWLANDAGNDAVLMARSLGPANVLVTSAFADGESGNLLVTTGETLKIGHEVASAPPNGVGDLTAALFLARKLEGDANAKALRKATGSVLALIGHSISRGSDELTLAADRNCITDPPMNLAVDSQ